MDIAKEVLAGIARLDDSIGPNDVWDFGFCSEIHTKHWQRALS